jgi:RNA polymerase sigma-70 factor (ECF subfamily)
MQQEPHEDMDRDRDLVARAQAGELAAFDELIGRHSGRMFQLAFGLLGNRQDAEEVVQDTFVRAYRNLAGFRGEASFSTWLYRIATNLARNKYQWNRRRGAEVNFSLSAMSPNMEDQGHQEDMAPPDESMGPDRIIEQGELAGSIAAAVNRLPEALREVMVLRHVEDLPYERIAEICGVRLGTVKSRLSRAREMVKQWLEQS